MPFKRRETPTLESLFVNEQGDPLCFYLRPGPLKRELLPLITAGGGLLCNVQKPGTILLKDPEEKTSITESTSHWYVSTKYIKDSFEKNKKLNIEEYRLNTASIKGIKTRSKVGSPALSGGRTAYIPEEDDAILSYVSKHVNDIGGNRLWREMAKQQVTSHTWQSMKYRYRAQLAQRLSEYQQIDMHKETQTHDTNESEAEIKTEEVSQQIISDEMGEQQNISSDVEQTLVSSSSESEEEQTEQQEEKNQDGGESMETSEIEEIPEQQPEPEQEEPVENAAKSENANNASVPVVNRPVTRQQSESENPPYAKKLRSGTTPKGLFKWPEFFTRAKPVSSLQKEQNEGQTPEKKIRKSNQSSVAEEIQEEGEQRDPQEERQTDEVFVLAPQPKKPVKRKLGILEMATKEFEDDSASDSDVYETPGASTSIEAVIGSSNCTNATSENQEKEASNAEPEQNAQDEKTTGATAALPASAATTTATTTTTTTGVTSAPDDPCTSDNKILEPTTGKSPSLVDQAPSKAHLFIFENESQEMEAEFQSLVGPSTSAAIQTNANKTSPSLTQDQLEEDVQLLKNLMKQTNQDLVSVTKALLKASGDAALAFEILQDPSSFSEPVWTQTDDQRLCLSDLEIRQDLLTKYGEEGVAKRLLFLEMEA